MKQKKTPFFSSKNLVKPWNIARLSSLVVHALLFLLAYFLYLNQKYLLPDLTDLTKQPIPTEEKKESYFLIDLVDPKDEETDEARVISLFNYKGLGQLIDNQSDQHLIGEFNPQAAAFASSGFSLLQSQIQKKKLNEPNKKLQEKKPPRKIAEAESIERPNDEPATETKTESNSPASSAPLGIVTRNSLEQSFWYDEGNQLQVASSYHPGSIFFLELKNNINRKFRIYVQSGGSLNYHFTKSDEAISLISINKQGVIQTEDPNVKRPQQPYLSYLVQSIGRGRIPIDKIPEKFLLSDDEKMFFYLKIKFNESPIKGWEYGLNFTKDFFN